MPAGSALDRLLDQLDRDRRREALTHRSWARPGRPSYERLELLGDAVLDLVVTEELLERHPDAAEGQVTFMRQAVVSRTGCARVSRAAGLPERMAELAPRAGSELAAQMASETVAAALAEAVIGAAWLDLGVQPTRDGIREAFAEELEGVAPGHRDPKSRLQELAAELREPVAYELLSQEGATHERRFESMVRVGEVERGRGRGASKQAAEQAAAAAALAELEGARC